MKLNHRNINEVESSSYLINLFIVQLIKNPIYCLINEKNLSIVLF